MAFLFPKSFPFCVPPEGETQGIGIGSGTNYPIGMSLRDAMFLFWKNKTFSSVASFTTSLDIPNFNGLGDSYDIVGNYSQSGLLGLGSVFWPEKMSEMICPSVPGNYFPKFRGTAGGTGVITSSFEPLEDLGSAIELEIFDYSFNSIIVRNNLYYPKISFLCAWAAAGSSGISNILIRSVQPELSQKINNSLIINVNGRIYMADLFVAISFPDSDDPRIPDSSSGVFEISGLADRAAN